MYKTDLIEQSKYRYLVNRKPCLYPGQLLWLDWELFLAVDEEQKSVTFVRAAGITAHTLLAGIHVEEKADGCRSGRHVDRRLKDVAADKCGAWSDEQVGTASWSRSNNVEPSALYHKRHQTFSANERSEGEGKGKEEERKGERERRKGKGNGKWSFGRNGKNRKRPSMAPGIEPGTPANAADALPLSHRDKQHRPLPFPSSSFPFPSPSDLSFALKNASSHYPIKHLVYGSFYSSCHLPWHKTQKSRYQWESYSHVLLKQRQF